MSQILDFADSIIFLPFDKERASIFSPSSARTFSVPILQNPGINSNPRNDTVPGTERGQERGTKTGSIILLASLESAVLGSVPCTEKIVIIVRHNSR